MEEFKEVARIDATPFDVEYLWEIYVRPYANEAYMIDVFAVLLFWYFKLFDQKYGTNIADYVEIEQIIGYSEETELDYMMWYRESGELFQGAMNSTGWCMGVVGTEDISGYLEDEEKSFEDENLFQQEYRKCLDNIFKDGFLKDALLREYKIMANATADMEDGILVIMWNPGLNDYMQYRKTNPDIIEAVCKDEDRLIVKLEEDIWEPYMAFFRQGKEMMDGMAYCKSLIGFSMDTYVDFGSVNPNWICTAVKLNKMLQLANEKLACFKAGQKNEEAA